MDGSDLKARTAAFDWLAMLVDLHDDVLPWPALKEGFPFEGDRVHVISQQGIFKPKSFTLPLSITTSPRDPYSDTFASGDLVYKYRGTDPRHRDNVGLREAMRLRVPLIYFHGIEKGKYVAAWPVFIVGDDPATLQFTVAVDDPLFVSSQLSGTQTEAEEVAGARRQYLTATFRQRVHQRSFRERVLRAYRNQCAVCRLRYSKLLEAAHIIPDRDPEGIPVVQNGISLCAIHHRAFDRHFIGIRPDYRVEVRADVLEEHDGSDASARATGDARTDHHLAAKRRSAACSGVSGEAVRVFPIGSAMKRPTELPKDAGDLSSARSCS